jgi:hypothetical protein
MAKKYKSYKVTVEYKVEYDEYDATSLATEKRELSKKRLADTNTFCGTKILKVTVVEVK